MMAFFQNSGQYFNAHVYLYLLVWFPVMEAHLFREWGWKGWYLLGSNQLISK